ncbi:unnamed protein product [Coffea canephora]|uniref:Uncharacterized protein n=1 Tax=Coffea canephora TaxID=49390 RepID=A0A068TMC4_COFCA|nr:unnamed protein product [Coffea canephora]
MVHRIDGDQLFNSQGKLVVAVMNTLRQGLEEARRPQKLGVVEKPQEQEVEKVDELVLVVVERRWVVVESELVGEVRKLEVEERRLVVVEVNGQVVVGRKLVEEVRTLVVVGRKLVEEVRTLVVVENGLAEVVSELEVGVRPLVVVENGREQVVVEIELELVEARQLVAVAGDAQAQVVVRI